MDSETQQHKTETMTEAKIHWKDQRRIGTGGIYPPKLKIKQWKIMGL